MARVFYYEPLFKSQCESVGRNFTLSGGLPVLMGSPMRIIIGDNVTLSGVTTLVGSKLALNPTLTVGDGTYIGYQTTIVSGRGVRIGRHVLIANRVFIAADDGHPLEAAARIANEPARPQDVKTITIGDAAWIGEAATVLKGVTIGEGAVVAAGAVVTKDVAPYTVVAGNPARVVKELKAAAAPDGA
jgi:acetyltransferase-like isoleucine patch superfamily enzyme